MRVVPQGPLLVSRSYEGRTIVKGRGETFISGDILYSRLTIVYPLYTCTEMHAPWHTR